MSWKTVLWLFAVLYLNKFAFSLRIDGYNPTNLSQVLLEIVPDFSLADVINDKSNHANIQKRSSEDPMKVGVERGINTVALNPGEKTKVLMGIKALSIRQPIFVVNVGKGDAEIGRIYKTGGLKKNADWKAIDDKRIIKPGEKQTFQFEGIFVRSALAVKNPSKVRVILYASRQDKVSGYSTIGQNYSEPRFKFDNIALKASKYVVGKGTKYVPTVGPALSVLVKAIWPRKIKEFEDPWVERLKGVKNLIGKAKYESVNFILAGKLGDYRSSIQDLMSKVNRSDVSEAYMRLVYQLRTVHNSFSCVDKSKDAEICYSVLPLYTQLINANLAFFNWGIRFAESINLSEQNLLDVIGYRNEMVATAIDYIEELYQERIEYTYDTCQPDEYYNSVMDVRRYMALYGLEYITHWKNIVDSESKVDYNLITYSPFHGMSSPNLYKQAILELGTEPLTPKLIASASGEQRRSKLVEVSINYAPETIEIHGIALKFEEGDPIQLGTRTEISVSFYMEDRVIEYLDVEYDGQIDYLSFHMSDGDDVEFGKKSGKGYKRFELADHYIASLFVANDIPSMKGRLANIAVSYQQKPIDEPIITG